MISEIQLIVCDECNTVSFGELAKCAQCEKMMKPARFIREVSAAKDEPLTLTDLPRPWSTDEMKRIPYEVYKDFEQGQPFKDER